MASKGHNTKVSTSSPDIDQEDFGKKQSQNLSNSANTVKNNAKNISNNARKLSRKMARKAKNKGKVKKAGNTLKNIAKGIFNAVKGLFKLILKAISYLISIFGPYTFIVLLVIIVIIAIIAGAVYVVFSIFDGGYDSQTQTTSSMYGIKGDSFYGMRTIYFDDEQTKNDLADIYLEFTNQILYDVNSSNNGITLNIDFTKNYNENEKIELITKNYAANLAGIEGLNLNSSTNIIDHYGFTNTEQASVISLISNYVIDNNLLLTSTTKTAFTKALNEAYESNFGYMKNVCAKILIKDYLLDENSTITNLPKKNYIASIFMPKQDVAIESTQIIYIVDNNQSVNTKLTYTKEGTKEILNESTADSSWFNGMATEMQEFKPETPLNITTFTAINSENTSYLTEGKSLFRIIREGNYNTYFKNTDQNYTNESIINNINSNEYLMLEFTSESEFNFIEFETKY